MKRRILAFFLALTFVFLQIPVNVVAAEVSSSADVYLSVEHTYGEPGTSVTVDINIDKNPGIAGAMITVAYDSGLTLTEVKNGAILAEFDFTYNKNLANKCIMLWDSLEGEIYQTGTVATLTFDISEDAEIYKDLSVNVSCGYGDIYGNTEDWTVETENGIIKVLDYIPGDIFEDKVINTKDIRLLRQYLVQSNDRPINEAAADVNDDGVINGRDTRLIRQYLAGGFGVVLIPHTARCQHTNLTSVPAKEATCTENGNIAYWSCECGKYFADENAILEITLENTVIKASHTPGAEATCTEPQICTECFEILEASKGHTEVPVYGYAATKEKEGLSDGVKCSVCDEWIVEQIVIPPLLPEEYSITYVLASGDYIDQGDAYLKKQAITNPNPGKYKENELLELEKLSTPGYTFDGWVDQTGARWDVIPAGTNRDLVLYAKWTQDVYTVNFDSPDIDVTYTWYDANLGTNVTLTNSAKYTIDTGLTLKSPKAYKYTFVGWSDDNGFIVNEIKPGTADNMTLRANWTSDRNRATSYANYGEPIIIEDNERKQFLFVYDIGKIDNVPLYTYKKANGTPVQFMNTTVDFTETTTLKTEFSREDAKNVAKTVANATTRSSGWTLSEEWEEVLSESQEDKDKLIKSEERTDSKGNVIGDTYFISNSEGGSSYNSVESGSSSSSSARVTTEDSFGINTSYDKSTEKYADAELKTGFKNETELSAGISAPVGIAKVEAGVKNTTTITADASLKSGRKDNEAFHVDTSSSSFIGTDFSSNSSSHYNAVTSNSTNWNSSTSYEKSNEMSQETTVAEAIAKEIESTTTYNISKALSGAKDNTESVSGTTSDETGYSNSVTVSEYFSNESVYAESHKDNNVGNHRLVEAGIVHVYGVVGYDIATASYYTYTFNVLEDETYAYWDYSLKDPSFKDCENGLVTFEIPYEVNEYIAGVTGKTEGLEIEIDDDGYGCVNAFDIPENFSGDVVIPQYLGADNLDDTFDPVVVTSFNANAFRGKENIKTVILPMYVTEIPDYAFEGCTNLETVIAYGVTKIGDYAFKGCEKLGKFINRNGETEFAAFMIDNMVTKLGKGAFEGVNEIKVMAYDSDVADAAINSGAKKVTVDLTKLKNDYTGTKEVTSDTEYFGIIGGGKTFSGLRIKSDATETFISNITLTDNTEIPLDLSSEVVTLARVTVENAPGLALMLSAENTALKLYQTVTLTSKSNNSVLSKNVALSKANASITGKLDFSGNYLVCGEITNTGMLTKPENVKTITVDEYQNYIGMVTISFVTNGGSEVAPILAGYDTKITPPATPTKDAHSFLGWYTDEACTAEFDFSTPVTSNITIYAKWKLNEFTVTFDAYGGNVDTKSKTVIYGEQYGELPVPTRTGYTFYGWFTTKENGDQITSDTVVAITADQTLYAAWRLNTYKVSWSVPTNGSVVVERTSSPLSGKPTGSLSSGDPVYHGDVLTIEYTANTGYSVATKGQTSITVVSDVTSNDIYLTVTPNNYIYNIVYQSSDGTRIGSASEIAAFGTTHTIIPPGFAGYSTPYPQTIKWDSTTAKTITFVYLPYNYTYNIVYQSSNGTHIGSDTKTAAFGTTQTITPPGFAGYSTPYPQTIKWDSTSAKTITFVYPPSGVEVTTKTGNMIPKWTQPKITYNAIIRHRNRTANSIQIRVDWTLTLSNGVLYHGIHGKATAGGVTSNVVKIFGYNYSGNKGTYSKTSDWFTVPVGSASTTSIDVAVRLWQVNVPEDDLTSSSWPAFNATWTVNIPKY